MMSCLSKTLHLWSGKCHLVDYLFSRAFQKMKISSAWLRHREGLERAFFKKAKPQKKKSINRIPLSEIIRTDPMFSVTK